MELMREKRMRNGEEDARRRKKMEAKKKMNVGREIECRRRGRAKRDGKRADG